MYLMNYHNIVLNKKIGPLATEVSEVHAPCMIR
jgi:hypothetical protein